jgi:hypothetical protein
VRVITPGIKVPVMLAGMNVAAGPELAAAVSKGGRQIRGSGGSLEPFGPLLEPLGLFLRTSIPFILRILSAFL